MKAYCLLLFVLLPLSTAAQNSRQDVLDLVNRLGGSVITTALPGSPIISIDLQDEMDLEEVKDQKLAFLSLGSILKQKRNLFADLI